MKRNRPVGRKVTHGTSSSGVGRKGSGTGSGKVGSGGYFSSDSWKPSSGSSGSSGGSQSDWSDSDYQQNYSGGGMGRVTRSKPGCLGIIVVILALLFGGGRFAMGEFGGPDYQESIQYGNGTYDGWYVEDEETGNTGQLDEQVASTAREKFTTIKGDGTDKVTLLVYMCGTDLESRSAMGSRDLNEMIKATISGDMNVVVYTGGCKQWQNDVISSQKNQVWLIKNGSIRCLEENAGDAPMTRADTLTGFIKYATKKYPANRTSLIFWDHGGGSISGYGYDQKYPRSGSMTLDNMNKALQNAGVKFDFIGFDACLMATAETALVCGNYADYMIGSEETEPGIGWYYTNWLSALSKDKGLATLEIGKMIADDFTAACAKQCRGQSTTLSVVDLSELSQTLPEKLNAFAADTSDLIQNGKYKQVATARGSSKEFARSQGLDQIDLVHFARLLDTRSGKDLANTLSDSIKYNVTSDNTRNAYGLSIYFPYKQLNRVDLMTNTYAAIGLDKNYTSCIRKFAQMETCGQAASGGYSSPFDFLMGGNNNTSYELDPQAMQQLFEALLGGNYTNFREVGIKGLNKENTRFLSEDPLDATAVTDYVSSNRVTEDDLVWQQNKNGDQAIILTDDQWDLIEKADLSMYYDDGEGYLELGLDNVFDFDDDGNLLPSTDKTWLSINGQPVAYYHMETTEYSDGTYTITGYVPCKLNDTNARLIIVFDKSNEQGYVAGATYDYDPDVTETAAKNLTGLKEGDKVKFLCDVYSHKGKFEDSYQIGNTLTVKDPKNLTITNEKVGKGTTLILYKFTDIYGQDLWTPALTK